MQRRCFSWDQIHKTCLQSVHQLQEEFAPTLLVAISGGGLIPARLLRSGFKTKTGKTLPLQVIGAVRYDDDNGKVNDTVLRTQWLSPDLKLSGQRILLVDEVDDSRTTLAFVVDEVLKYLDQVRVDYEASGNPEPWVEPQLATYVIHNKIRPKERQLDPRVFPERYYVGLHVPNLWHSYPYDAEDIEEHNAIANAQEHFFRERPGELEMAVVACAEVDPSLAKYAATAVAHYAMPQPVPPLPTPPKGLPQRLNSLTRLSAPNADVNALVKDVPPSQEGGAAPQDIPAALHALPDGHTFVDTDYIPTRDGIYTNLSQTLVPKGYVPRIGSLTLVSTMDEMADRTQSTGMPLPAQITDGTDAPAAPPVPTTA